jgi:molybdopterin/thiamine biosynthesis adenylyltransferase
MFERIHIIGAGGIGSYVCKSLAEAVKQRQISAGIGIHVYDPDEVVEKNIMYQDFKDLDITDYKVDVMSDRYAFQGHNKKADKIFLSNTTSKDLVVCCVDNPTFRRDLFEELAETDKAFFIDLRSEGRFITWYTKSDEYTKEKLMRSLGKDETESSCQLPYRFEQRIIDNGNKIIAEIGVQLILNILRKEKFSSHMALII